MSTSSVTGLLTNGTSNSTSSTTTSTSSLTSMDSFLKLFTTQLQYQDPNNPMQSYELSSQLAQFSTVEALTKVNSNLSDLKDYVASLNNAEMLSLVGKDITAQDGTLLVSSGSASSAAYTLPTADDGSAKNYTVKATITDSSGATVRTIDLGTQSSGDLTLQWDGKNGSGNSVSDGSYTCSITATDESGNVSTISPSIQGTVYSVRLKSGVPYLVLNNSGGIEIPASEVTEVSAS